MTDKTNWPPKAEQPYLRVDGRFFTAGLDFDSRYDDMPHPVAFTRRPCDDADIWDRARAGGEDGDGVEFAQYRDERSVGSLFVRGDHEELDHVEFEEWPRGFPMDENDHSGEQEQPQSGRPFRMFSIRAENIRDHWRFAAAAGKDLILLYCSRRHHPGYGRGYPFADGLVPPPMALSPAYSYTLADLQIQDFYTNAEFTHTMDKRPEVQRVDCQGETIGYLMFWEGPGPDGSRPTPDIGRLAVFYESSKKFKPGLVETRRDRRKGDCRPDGHALFTLMLGKKLGRVAKSRLPKQPERFLQRAARLAVERWHRDHRIAEFESLTRVKPQHVGAVGIVRL